MKYILDTNVLLWFMEENQLLPANIRDTILENDNEIFISNVTLWEISIKYSIGKLKLSLDLESFLNDIENNECFKIMPIMTKHLVYLSKLPFIHKDPFDRIIYSTAKSEMFELLYTDEIFEKYKSV